MLGVNLALKGRACLVVGGGGVALRKVEGLLEEDAAITLIAPEPLPALVELSRRRGFPLHRRPYRDGEAAAYRLVFAATDDREVNRQVFRDAEKAGVWVNVADDPELCTFHLPARLRRGALSISIATGGKAPFVSRRIRQLLEKLFGPEWAEWIEAARAFRDRVRARGESPSVQERRYDAFFSSTVDAARLRARVPSEEDEAAWLASIADSEVPASPEAVAGPGADAHPCRQARREAEPRAGADPSPAATGLVSLVGSGPGDPTLLTLRALLRLRRADAVVYDRLAASALPCDLAPRVELHCVGKQPGHHPIPQEEINRLLVRLAREGKRVVRLKGGDPFVFGRGGEEAEALREAGLPFEVVPGITAGIAVPAYAGIPLTHRREAVRATLLTAHESADAGATQVRWDLLAQDAHSTIVGYMGVTSLPRVVEQLVAGGMDPSTPAAVIERGTVAGQRQVFAPLRGLVEAASEAAIAPPALFIIGPTVARAAQLEWLAALPLAGQRIALIAPSPDLADTLALAGAEVVALPLPLTEAARAVLGASPLTTCLLRSAADAEALDGERDRPEWGPKVIAWCLGEGAARRAGSLGWREVRVLPDEARPDEITRALAGG